MGTPRHDHDHGHGPDHRHGHGPDHYHHHGAEGGWEPSRPGTVMLDIGPGMGALVVVCPADLLGAEIEAEPLDWAAPRPLVHTAVRERFLPGGIVHAAVFQALPCGRYRLALHEETSALVECAEVISGSVSEVTAPVRAPAF